MGVNCQACACVFSCFILALGCVCVSLVFYTFGCTCYYKSYFKILPKLFFSFSLFSFPFWPLVACVSATRVHRACAYASQSARVPILKVSFQVGFFILYLLALFVVVLPFATSCRHRHSCHRRCPLWPSGSLVQPLLGLPSSFPFPPFPFPPSSPVVCLFLPHLIS